MPNYDYQCPECDHRFEIRQSVGDAPPECPQCGAVTKKVFQVPRIIFKGSGFYVTDKRSESAAGKSEKAGAAASSEKSSENASSESKSEPAKSETPAAEKAAPKIESTSATPVK